MNQASKSTHIERLNTLLSDGQWHSSQELAEKLDQRLEPIIYEARKRGYIVEKRKVTYNKFEYRIRKQNQSLSIDNIKPSVPLVIEQMPYIKLLVLFGSRARGNENAESDWDFAIFWDEELRKIHEQGEWFRLKISSVLGNIFKLPEDKVDVVELNHCSPLIGFLVACDGKLLYEKESLEFTKFRCKAWKIYADTAKFRKARHRSIELALQNWGV